MTTATDSPNPFEAYQGEEVAAPVRPAGPPEDPPASMFAIVGLVLIVALVAIIAWRGRSK